jgi:translation initiation factor 5B
MSSKPKAKPKPTAQIAALKQRLELQKTLIAHQEAEKLALIEKEKEAERLEKEQLEQVALKQKKRIEDRELLRKQGKLLSKAQRQKQEKLQAYAQSLRKNGNLQVSDRKHPESVISASCPIELADAKIRSPICCMLASVDAGKTRLIDALTNSRTMEREAGRITQKVSCHYRSGMLLIDCPGHLMFEQMRQRAVDLSDLAILVVDIMHGLKPLTIDCVNLLRSNQKPFIVALNKIDCIYQWTPLSGSFQSQLSQQSQATRDHFEKLVSEIMVQFGQLGLSSVLANENTCLGSVVSLVPTSASTGAGLDDLVNLVDQLSHSYLRQQVTRKDQLDCLVMDVRVQQGHGTVLDVILANGRLAVGDHIYVGSSKTPTTIRNLMPIHPSGIQRIVEAPMSLTISAPELDGALVGSHIYLNELTDIHVIDGEPISIDKRIDICRKFQSEVAVYFQCESLGALESLVYYAEKSGIKVVGYSIGTVYKKDIIEASAAGADLFLGFGVELVHEAIQMAEREEITVKTSKIVYKLIDFYHIFVKNLHDELQKPHESVILEILPQHIFNKCDPVILGCHVVEGTLRVGMKLSTEKVDENVQTLVIGIVESIKKDNVEVKKIGLNDGDFSVKIVPIIGTSAPLYGRHFDSKNRLISIKL